jgi:hypothetical protein
VSAERSLVRTLEDLERTVRAIARHFKSDEVFIIGSQSILLSWPDAPAVMRTSGEIDAYPGNARLWEIDMRKRDPKDAPEASEEIAALFGEGSQFHENHGFYIDGVDEGTARLPKDWMQRSINRSVDVDGRKVLVIAPCPEDVIVSKLARLSEKDKEFVAAYHKVRPLDPKLMEDRIKNTDMNPAIAKQAIDYIQHLTKA